MPALTVPPPPARPTREPESLDDVRYACEYLKGLIEADRLPEAREFSRRVAERWPDDREARHWDEVLAPPKLLPTPKKTPWPGRELAWVQEHGHEYPGCWLLLHDGELVMADPSQRKVLAASKGYSPDVSGYITFVPRTD